jgi:hypothetical protein
MSVPTKLRMKKSQSTRVTLDLSGAEYGRLQRLTTSASKADVLRRALQLYEFYVTQVASGGIVKSVDPTGKETIIQILGID